MHIFTFFPFFTHFPTDGQNLISFKAAFPGNGSPTGVIKKLCRPPV